MIYLNKEIGSLGENLAKDFLIKEGYEILDMNYRCKIGEIDLISKINDIICFVEVKTRYFNTYGTPIESITLRKQQKIYKIAQYYSLKNKLNNVFFRFDVIEVILNMNSNDFTLNLIKNAFWPLRIHDFDNNSIKKTPI